VNLDPRDITTVDGFRTHHPRAHPPRPRRSRAQPPHPGHDPRRAPFPL
jgi:hypothetical protein